MDNVIDRRLENLEDSMKNIEVLIRVNNLLLSRFILQLSSLKETLNIPKRETFFKFDLLEEDYQELLSEFEKEAVDKALYRLDRLLMKNKQNCPNNIKKYIRNKLRKNSKRE